MRRKQIEKIKPATTGSQTKTDKKVPEAKTQIVGLELCMTITNALPLQGVEETGTVAPALTTKINTRCLI